MDKINCTWEIDNLGKKTLEYNISEKDCFNREDFIDPEYEYLVAKVPTGKPDYLIGLPQLGFCQIESQFVVSKNYKSINFEDTLIKSLYKKTEFKRVLSMGDLDYIFSFMTKKMFTTDRVSIDPVFGPDLGLQRYRNWMKTNFEKNNSIILLNINRGKEVGFTMLKTENDVSEALLGGLFEQYQNCGIGLLTPLAVAIYINKEQQQCKLIKTSISSNNFPVIEFYNYLNYRIDKIINVFIKHQ